MEESTLKAESKSGTCPECGSKQRLYRTPKGLRCGECVKRMDSGGLGFR